MKKFTCVLCVTGLILSLSIPLFAQDASTRGKAFYEARKAETPAQRDARMKWWREARFGMFVHWGPSALSGGEWNGKPCGDAIFIMMLAKLSIQDFRAFAAHFNPVEFNADSLVAAARNAGMKYLVLITKHHDGFAMWPSKVSDFNLVDHTPFKRDVVAEVAAACRKQDIKFGAYYSQYFDWTHPNAYFWVENTPAWDPAQKGDFNKYLLTISAPQVRELVENYKPDILWWDMGGTNLTPEQTYAFYDALSGQPNILTNNRLSPQEKGDFETPEQKIPPTGLPYTWETCQTINRTWGYTKSDTNWKSSPQLIRELIDVVSKGGNYLLNVSPDEKGLLPQPELDRLSDIGAWMKVNGSAIYGTTASPFPTQLPWGRCTQKPGKLFLHVFDWPADAKLLVPVKNKVTRACLLAVPDKPLATAASADGVTVELPAATPDANASVVVLEIDGPVKVVPQPAK